MSSSEVLQVERRGEGVALVTLDRPDKRNALNRKLRQAIIDALDALGADDDVKVVVVCGSGGVFCAGFDLDELMAADDQAAVFAHSTSYHHAVHSFTKPLVAAIEGAAVAGGMDLALMCDLRVAATNARFGQPQVKMGVPAAFELVRMVVPEPVARELCLTGRIIDADEATEAGLVNRSVEPGGALEAALALAGEIAAAAGSVTMKQVFVKAQPALFTNEGADS
ncbi:MAG: enoyl-CoA hydratase/isomerase family protein [Actinomycetia bacterium]|nr:enoyl-CoA hydratase/isomerase family protein [Actinomycetes bacterium]